MTNMENIRRAHGLRASLEQTIMPEVFLVFVFKPNHIPKPDP